MSKREKTVTTFDGAIVAAGNPLQSRDNAICFANRLWADMIPTQHEWHEHEYLRGIVELLADMFGSPFEGEVDGDTIRDWYAYKIGGCVK
ncbi:hypothetical protein Pan2_74 [Pseudanabaena phage Pan2]|nr:hypothetical protein Pan2_74 [Pseudanabaena phage Pan2]